MRNTVAADDQSCSTRNRIKTVLSYDNTYISDTVNTVSANRVRTVANRCRELLIVGQQVHTNSGNRLDLLGMDVDGDLHLIELKRDRTPRDMTSSSW